MRYEELNKMMSEIGIPYAYRQFERNEKKAPPAPPYAIFYYDGNDDFYADDENFVEKKLLVIEVYTRKKNIDLEKRVRKVLKKYELAFDSDEVFIESENVHEVIYETEVIIDE